MRRVVVEGWTYETDLDVEIGDRVLLPDSGTGEWIGTVTSLESSYDGPARRVTGLVERAAVYAERRVAMAAVRVNGWRVDETLEAPHECGGRAVLTVLQVNRLGRPEHVSTRCEGCFARGGSGLGSAEAWRATVVRFEAGRL